MTMTFPSEFVANETLSAFHHYVTPTQVKDK